MVNVLGGWAVGQSDPFTEAHSYSDLDFEPDAQHHTLGYGANQAAPGSEVDSRLKKLEAAVPYAKGYCFGSGGGSFISGSYVPAGTPDNQFLQGGMTYDAFTGTYVVPKAGLYNICAEFLFAFNTVGDRAIALYVAGLPHYHYVSAASTTRSVNIAGVFNLGAGGGIQPHLRQDSGGLLGLNVGSQGFNFITIAYVGAT